MYNLEELEGLYYFKVLVTLLLCMYLVHIETLIQYFVLNIIIFKFLHWKFEIRLNKLSIDSEESYLLLTHFRLTSGSLLAQFRLSSGSLRAHFRLTSSSLPAHFRLPSSYFWFTYGWIPVHFQWSYTFTSGPLPEYCKIIKSHIKMKLYFSGPIFCVLYNFLLLYAWGKVKGVCLTCEQGSAAVQKIVTQDHFL